MNPSWHMTVAAMTVAALAAAACAPAPENVPIPAGAVAVDPPRPVAEFRVSDQHGRPFQRRDLHGHWTVLFSGFTHCPDVCPATLAILRAAQNRNAAEPAHRTVLVSVDPERDTPEVLRDYLAWFDPEWVGLTGDPEELGQLLDSLGMAHVRVPTGGGGYTMDHATALALIDPQARLVAYWKAPLDPDRLAADLGALGAP